MTAETRKWRSRSGPERGLSPVAALVRRHDRNRYLTALFAPAGRREALFALYAFNYEIARVREVVTQPILGQIRLQWWREAIAAAFAGAAPRAHVVAEPLAAVVRNYAPTRAHFDRLIDARERDLADQPPADLAALADYAEATSAPLIYLALEVLGVRDAAAGAAAREIGMAYALAGLLRALPFHAGAGRQDLSAGIDRRDDTALPRAVAAVADAAARHLANARRHAPAVPRAALPALLPAIVAERALARLQRAGCNPFNPRLAAPDPLLTWRLAGAMLLGRF